MKCDIGLIGLAVMGENLALNMESRGFGVAVYNRTAAKTDAFASGRGMGKNIAPVYSLTELARAVKRPRRIMLMVKAGAPVDAMLDGLLQVLEPGDVVIDGGNSNYADTERRAALAQAAGLLYVGTGVSGGEEGALKGPSMMPGGTPGAWPVIKDVFEAICARTSDGEPCCGWVGPGGSGHFVKMVHNGIEYGDMQLICEAYHIMSAMLGMTNDEMSRVFAQWNEGELKSYLIEITRDILRYREKDGSATLDSIVDKAGQKGTGRWTAQNALEQGVPMTLVTEAVFARCLSARRDERLRASDIYGSDIRPFTGGRGELLSALGDAVYAAKLVSYAQGFELMSQAGKSFGWGIDLGAVALMWRGGCIIRSEFLGRIREAYDRDPELDSLLADPFFSEVMKRCAQGLRTVVASAAMSGLPVPAMSAALAFFDGRRAARLPANLLQAQRDYFGAHGYERIDATGSFHTDWTGHGGDVTSGSYNA